MLSNLTEESVKHKFGKNWCQRIGIKVVMSAVFLVKYTNKKSTYKASYALWFELSLSVFNGFMRN